ATSVSPGQVRVQAPQDVDRRVKFLGQLLEISVTAERPRAEVVIDAQSGTVVMGADVEIGPAAVAYGGLSVTINEKPEVSQPAPFSRGGQTVVVPRTTVTAEQKQLKIIELKSAPRISDIVRNLNAIGARSVDLIAILQALRGAGALHAHIKVI
ncbi:MAG: flagellar basal body P-ring protein FlgI, partial [Stellaceae bacterium]